MNNVWCIQNGCAETWRSATSTAPWNRRIRHFDELRLSGGLIRAEGRVIAFSIGDPPQRRHLSGAF